MANKKQPKKRTESKPKTKKAAVKSAPKPAEKANANQLHELGHQVAPKAIVETPKIVAPKKKSLLRRIFGF